MAALNSEMSWVQEDGMKAGHGTWCTANTEWLLDHWHNPANSSACRCIACHSRLFSLRPLNHESEFPVAGWASVCSNSLLPAHVIFWWACNSRRRWAGGGGGWLACFLHLARDVIMPTDSDLQRASACKSVPNKTPRELLTKQKLLEVVWSALNF